MPLEDTLKSSGYGGECLLPNLSRKPKTSIGANGNLWNARGRLRETAHHISTLHYALRCSSRPRRYRHSSSYRAGCFYWIYEEAELGNAEVQTGLLNKAKELLRLGAILQIAINHSVESLSPVARRCGRRLILSPQSPPGTFGRVYVLDWINAKEHERQHTLSSTS